MRHFRRFMFDPDAPALEGSGIFGVPPSLRDPRVVLVPVPWDATTSYRAGASKGPNAIFEASGQVDLYDVETGRPYEAGITMLEDPSPIAAWNAQAREAAEPIIAMGGMIEGRKDLRELLDRVNALGASVNQWVESETERWLDRGKLVGVVGGDHSVPFGAIRAIARRHPGLGILHIDAHADLREAFEGFTWSHASIMYNVVRNIPEVACIVQVGIRDVGEAEVGMIERSKGRVITHFDALTKTEQMKGARWSDQCARMIEDLPREVYVSFDIDGLDPALCPHTGTPVPGGLSWPEATHLIAAVVQSGRKIVGFDLNEVAPGPDGDEWDANVGARMLYKLIGWMVRSQG